MFNVHYLNCWKLGQKKKLNSSPDQLIIVEKGGVSDEIKAGFQQVDETLNTQECIFVQGKELNAIKDI